MKTPIASTHTPSELLHDLPAQASESPLVDFSQFSLERAEYDPDTLSDLGLEDYDREDCGGSDKIEWDDAEL
ncbi:uncharacterized protein JCM6883_004589 [Sporobolomyces salmoneus]|uniref:uncharacterized protein n=1 Tax=Sporobolomyces salmoneus TaxID=183962 RepID=UPI00317F2F89